jgi:hypothetical protein
VEDNQTHTALDDVLFDAGDNLILDLMMRHMAPPNQDIGLVEYGFGQAMLGLIKCSSFDHQVFVVFNQALGNSTVNTFGVEGGCRVIRRVRGSLFDSLRL